MAGPWPRRGHQTVAHTPLVSLQPNVHLFWTKGRTWSTPWKASKENVLKKNNIFYFYLDQINVIAKVRTIAQYGEIMCEAVTSEKYRDIVILDTSSACVRPPHWSTRKYLYVLLRPAVRVNRLSCAEKHKNTGDSYSESLRAGLYKRCWIYVEKKTWKSRYRNMT